MNRGAGVPWRPLAVLGLAVSALHGLALQGAPATIAWHRPSPQLLVRAIAPPAAAEASPAPREVEDHRQVAVPKPPARRSTPPTRTTPSTPPPQTTPVAPVVQAPAAPGAAVPGSARWQYLVSARQRGADIAGRAELRWLHDGARYEAVLRIEAPPLPVRLQRSAGMLGADGLRPLRFAERLRTESAVHFEHEAGRIVFSSNRPDAALEAGAQDRLSVLLQLAALKAADPGRLGAGTRVTVQTAGTRDADRWTFLVDAEETLTLPGGLLPAQRLTRAARGDYDLQLELWLGPADYGPVRLRLTAPNGDWLDLQWSGTDKG